MTHVVLVGDLVLVGTMLVTPALVTVYSIKVTKMFLFQPQTSVLLICCSCLETILSVSVDVQPFYCFPFSYVLKMARNVLTFS